MRRVRWKRKDAFVQTCSKRKFGECGSQLFCPKTCQSLRSTGGVRSLSSLVRRADSHMKPRGANRTPSASLSAAAPPSNSGRGFQRGGALPSSPVPLGVGFFCPVPRLREGFPKGRDRSPAPLCHEGVWGTGGVPHVSGGGLRGRDLCAKGPFPLPRSGNCPLREQTVLSDFQIK